MKIPTHEPDIYMEVRDSLNDFQIVREVFCEDVYRVRPFLSGETKAVMDVGACFGAFSRYVQKHAPNAEVYAVEPESHNIELLEQNTGAKVVRTALGESPDSTTISSKGGESKLGEEGQSVDVITLTYLWDELQLESLDVLKIDTEGSELAILQGTDSDILASIGYICMEFHGNLGAIVEILARSHNVTTLGNKEGYIYGKRY